VIHHEQHKAAAALAFNCALWRSPSFQELWKLAAHAVARCSYFVPFVPFVQRGPRPVSRCPAVAGCIAPVSRRPLCVDSRMAARYSKAYRAKEEATTSIARVYLDINDKRPPEYWDYENLNVQVALHTWPPAAAARSSSQLTRALDMFACSGASRTTTRWSGRSGGASTAKCSRCAPQQQAQAPDTAALKTVQQPLAGSMCCIWENPSSCKQGHCSCSHASITHHHHHHHHHQPAQGLIQQLCCSHEQQLALPTTTQPQASQASGMAHTSKHHRCFQPGRQPCPLLLPCCCPQL
jgi:hypothetical protein